jgi:hypothetical protein
MVALWVVLRQAAAVGMKIARLLAQGYQAVLEGRANRAKLEAELFCARHHLSNDDDLPVVR